MWIAVLWVACGQDPLRIEVLGCHRLVGDHCYVKRASTVALVMSDDESPTLDVDGSPRALDDPQLAAGAQRIDVATTFGRWTVRSKGRTWGMTVEAWPDPPPPLQAVNALPRGPERLQALEAAYEGLDGRWKLETHYRLAVKQRPGFDLTETVERAASDQYWHLAAIAGTRHAHVLSSRDRDGAGAVRALDAAREAERHLRPVRSGLLAYSIDLGRGFALRLAGRHREAVEVLRDAETRARRQQEWSKSAMAAELAASSLIESGRRSEGLAVLEDAVARSMAEGHPCVGAASATRLAWFAMQMGDHPDARAIDVEGLLRRAVTERGAECPGTYDLAEVAAQAHLNLAVLAARRGNAAKARAELARARTAWPELDDPWALETEGRIALLEGDAVRALALYEQLDASAAGRLELQWHALRGQGAAFERLGTPERAIGAYERAQQMMFEQSWQVPVHYGREAFLAERRNATDALARLHLAAGHPRRAFDAHRNQRAQFLLGIHQVTALHQSDEGSPALWFDTVTRLGEAGDEPLQVRLEALDASLSALGLDLSIARRRPADGEVLLGWFATSTGFVGFAERDGRVDVARHRGQPQAVDLIAPFGALLTDARMVTLLLDPPLHEQAVHLAQLHGRPLIERVPVRYGLDLAEPTGLDHGRRLLVVTGAQQELPFALRSGQSVRDLMVERFKVTSLLGPRATRASFVEALSRADWLYFAGHARVGDGWDRRLELVDGSFGVADVLAAPRLPRVVVMNACEAALDDVGSLGLAQAFVAGGAEVVLASPQTLRQDAAAAFAEGLFRRVNEGQSVGTAYQDVVRIHVAAERQADRNLATIRWLSP